MGSVPCNESVGRSVVRSLGPPLILNMDVQRLVDESLRKTIILPRAPGILLYLSLSSQISAF